jgi:hypothetical protein
MHVGGIWNWIWTVPSISQVQGKAEICTSSFGWSRCRLFWWDVAGAHYGTIALADWWLPIGTAALISFSLQKAAADKFDLGKTLDE